jgi:polyisoprenoid-binding protein YceI
MEHTKWAVEPTHSELGFKIKHLMISHVTGFFKEFDATVEMNGQDFATAQVNAVIQIASVDTKNSQRDEHLRNSDFFDAPNYPEMKFSSAKIDKVDDDYIMHGQLTLKGITKPVKLNVTFSGAMKDPWGGDRAGFTIEGKINRGEWGLSFNSILDSGGLGLGEEVKIFAEVQMVKQVASVAA